MAKAATLITVFDGFGPAPAPWVGSHLGAGALNPLMQGGVLRFPLAPVDQGQSSAIDADFICDLTGSRVVFEWLKLPMPPGGIDLSLLSSTFDGLDIQYEKFNIVVTSSIGGVTTVLYNAPYDPETDNVWAFSNDGLGTSHVELGGTVASLRSVGVTAGLTSPMLTNMEFWNVTAHQQTAGEVVGEAELLAVNADVSRGGNPFGLGLAPHDPMLDEILACVRRSYPPP